MRTSVCSNSRRSVTLIGALFVTLMAPLVGYAQDPVTMITSTPYAEPAETLVRLESGERNISMLITAAFKKDRQINDSTVILGNYDRYTDAQRREILDGVERIAQGVEGDYVAEMEAFRVLSVLGHDPELNMAYEIPDRLLRIYELARTDDVKRTVVGFLGRVLRTSPRASPQIVELLASLVNQPVVTRQLGYHGNAPVVAQVVEGPVHPNPDDALDALLSACEASAPVLRRLAANRGAIKHDAVRARVDSLAREGLHRGACGLRRPA